MPSKAQILADIANGKVYNEGDFSFFEHQQSAEIISKHWKIAKSMHLEEYFKNAKTPFMFNTDEILIEFGEKVSPICGHSGASFAIICRHMKAIFSNWQKYVNEIVANYE